MSDCPHSKWQFEGEPVVLACAACGVEAPEDDEPLTDSEREAIERPRADPADLIPAAEVRRRLAARRS